MAPKEPPISQSLLARAHSPTTASTIHTTKVLHRPLHLKPTSPPPPTLQTLRRLTRTRLLSQRKKKLKPAPLSSRQKRALCLYEIPPAVQKYAIYEPLHEMWLGYIREVLRMDGCGDAVEGHGHGREVWVGTAAAARLCSADYHGAELEVVRSRCVSRVGVRGIVIKDRKFVFEVVTRRDQVKMVPKEHTVFRFRVPRRGKAVEVDGHAKTEQDGEGEVEDGQAKIKNDGKDVVEARKDLIFELHGDQFIYRAADRANRKFKTHFLPDL